MSAPGARFQELKDRGTAFGTGYEKQILPGAATA
jgi:hypothetical protein